MDNLEDLKLADDLQREIDDYGQAGAHEASTTEEQDWINTARLATGALRAGGATDEQRDAARSALEHTPPPRP
jgi:hypothetical protein